MGASRLVQFRRLIGLPMSVVRRIRWRAGAWSRDSDRTYHDQLYSAQDYDPFCADYAGNVTIRRFADHVELLMPTSGTVLDVGCGPGEITCELARRHPGLAFVGIDHSEQAIARAIRNAERLNLTNVTFAAIAAERLPAGKTYGLVVMFDAFHHLERPREFMEWVRARTSRCVLVEPAGTSTGRWARSMDVDWLLLDVANIRERLEALCVQAPIQNGAESSPLPSMALDRGEGAVERRYALDDFQAFFEGWNVRVTGTIAGFDRYPPNPYAKSELRRVAGEAVYDFVVAAENLLVQDGRDGDAKHWVIAATTEDGVIQPRLPARRTVSNGDVPARSVTSAFDIQYRNYAGPARVSAGGHFSAIIEIVNLGWSEWRSDAENAVHASYHWLSHTHEMLEFNGERSDLPRPVGPGDTCQILLNILAPSAPGNYVLAIDLVKEGVTWFSEVGMPWCPVRVKVCRT